jgi:hypothetical protein
MKRLTLLALLLAGCASSRWVGPAPLVDGPAAEIVVARESRFLGSAGALVIAIDGIPVYELANGDEIVLRVPAGLRTVTVWGLSARSVRIDAAPGSRHRVATRVTMSGPDVWEVAP